MNFKDNIMLTGSFLILFLLSIWLQFGILQPVGGEISEMEKNDPDYYAEKFVSTGMDETGKKYEVVADRMVHYPVDDRALLDNPHIIQYDFNGAPRHIYAESGWLYDEQSKILMTGNVRVIQTQTGSVGGAVSTEKMVIHLREKRG